MLPLKPPLASVLTPHKLGIVLEWALGGSDDLRLVWARLLSTLRSGCPLPVAACVQLLTAPQRTLHLCFSEPITLLWAPPETPSVSSWTKTGNGRSRRREVAAAGVIVAVTADDGDETATARPVDPWAPRRGDDGGAAGGPHAPPPPPPRSIGIIGSYAPRGSSSLTDPRSSSGGARPLGVTIRGTSGARGADPGVARASLPGGLAIREGPPVRLWRGGGAAGGARRRRLVTSRVGRRDLCRKPPPARRRRRRRRSRPRAAHLGPPTLPRAAPHPPCAARPPPPSPPARAPGPLERPSRAASRVAPRRFEARRGREGAARAGAERRA